MLTLRKQTVSLYVDKSNQQWILRDPEGAFWILPSIENPWEHRERFEPTDDSELESVPGHYIYMFNLPF